MPEATEVADRKKITAKQLWICVAWLGVGIVLGQFTQRFIDPLWSKLTLVPFGRFLDAHKTKDNHALLMSLVALWIGVPKWGLGTILGILGGLFTKEHLLLHLVLFGMGFALFPMVLHLYFYFALPSIDTIGWETFTIGLVIFFGSLTHSLAHRKTKT